MNQGFGNRIVCVQLSRKIIQNVANTGKARNPHSFVRTRLQGQDSTRK